MSGKKWIAVFLAAVMVFTLLPAISGAEKVYAADVIGSLNGKNYTSFKKLVNDLDSDYEDKSVTIEMKDNWNTPSNSDFDRRLVIPSGCRATLNMHGYIFNRDNTRNGNWSLNGELIAVESDATLTINGGSSEEEKSRKYDIPVHTSNNTDGRASKVVTVYGATLSGGCSTDAAGGIHIKSGSTVTLNDVSIVGCRAEDTIWTSGGWGGGIRLKGDNINLRLNNTTITGCLASDDGGGIYAGGSNVNIELKNSHIDKNYANDKGGGINPDGKNTYVRGDGISTISYNVGYAGGGIYAYKPNQSYSGLNLIGNRALDGAGVFAYDENITLSGLTLMDNIANERGGGIYIRKNGNTLKSCEIAGNRAKISGGGVYVNSNIDEGFKVTGKMIIRDNSSDSGMGKNLYLSDDDPEDNRVMFNLIKGSDVRMSYFNTDNMNAIMVTEGKAGDTKKSPNCLQYLMAENPGYHFTYNSKPDQRKIYYVKDGRDSASCGEPVYMPESTVTVYPEWANNASTGTGERPENGGTTSGIVGYVGPGGEQGYDYFLLRGFSHHQMSEGGEDGDSVFYYSDGFFDSDPAVYNEHIATASLSMAFSGMYLTTFEQEDVNGNAYYNKHAGIRQFLADIGCPDQRIYVNESNVSKPGTDSIGVTIASKELATCNGEKTGTILVPVVVRGGGYEREWASNATLGRAVIIKDAEAQGFSEAATQVVEEVDRYISKYGLETAVNEGRVAFWVTGFSRAGATANLTSKRLIEKYANGNGTKGSNKVFGYTCEAPMGGSDEAEKLSDKTKYYSIHNMINAADFVPLVAPQLMGFKRYGVDHYIPGTEAGAVQTQSKTVTRSGEAYNPVVTTYKDNEPLYIKGNAISSEQKEKMLTQLRTMDSGIVLDDYFHPMSMDFVPDVEIYENGDYAGNNLEDFLLDFIRFAQEGQDSGASGNWPEPVENRVWYNQNLQNALRNTLALVFTMSDEESEGFLGRASTIMDKISKVSLTDVSKLEIYRNVINYWSNLSDSEKRGYITFFWERIKDSGAFDYLSQSDLSALDKNWPKLADFLFTLVFADKSYAPGKDKAKASTQKWAKGADEKMMYLATFASYATYILQNHYPEVNLAWARSYDSYYASETREFYVANGRYQVAKPSASVEEAALQEGSGKVNTFHGNQKVILENPEIVGEAIYYDLTDTDTGTVLAVNRICQGGIDLSLENAAAKNYTITAYSISYGVRSEKAVYNIRLVNDRHRLRIVDKDKSGNEKTTEILYKEGLQVTLEADVPSGQKFDRWTVYMLDENGEIIPYYDPEEVTVMTLGLNKDVLNPAVFTMPLGADTGFWPQTYGLLFVAGYKDRIKSLEVDGPDPVVGSDLEPYTLVSFGNGRGDFYPVAWTCSYEENGETRTAPADKTVYNDTVYTATVNIMPDPENDILFDTVVETGLKNRYDSSAQMEETVVRNDADGSITLRMTFPATEPGETSPRPEMTESFRIGAYDLNLKDYDQDVGIQTFYTEPYKYVTLMAPEVPGERFEQWDLGDSGITLQTFSGNELTNKSIAVEMPEKTGEDTLIRALYTPVISRVDINMYDEFGYDYEPEGQLKGPDETEVFVTISNTYEIHPDNLEISWTPEPAEDGSFGYHQNYTATVRLKPDEDGSVRARIKDSGEEWQETQLIFYPAEDLEVFFNGEDGAMVSFNIDDLSASRTFPDRRPVLGISVLELDSVIELPHGVSAEQVLEALPKTVEIQLSDKTSRNVPVLWETAEPDQPADSLEQILWSAWGSLQLPEDVEETEPTTVKAFATAAEAESAKAPDASLDTGTYLGNRVITLETEEEGGVIFYTTDGSDPLACGQVYQGEEIFFSREDLEADENGVKRMTLQACTKAEGKWDSTVSTYVYVFDNEIPVPEGEQLVYSSLEQVGVSAGKFYSVAEVSNGGRITEDGDAAGTAAGTYQVRLKLADENYRWKLPELTEDGEAVTTEEDQIVSFVISPLSMDEVSISGLGSKPYTGKAITQKPVVSIQAEGKEIKLAEGGDYELSWRNNTDAGKAVVTVTGTGNLSGSVEKTFEITPVPISSVTLGYKTKAYTGSALKPSVTVQAVVDGSTVTLKEARDYSLQYKNNVNAGSASVVVTGKGNYSGSKTESFTITKPLKQTKITLSKTSFKYNGKERRPVVTVVDGAKTLKKNTDYTVSWSNNKNVGKGTVTIKGKGGYSGTVKKTFKIVKADNPLKLQVSKKTYKASSLKNKKAVFDIGASKGKGKVTYTLNSKAKSAKIKVSGKGRVTVPKGCKAGTYKITVKAAGTKNYNKGKKTVTITVK